MPTKRTRTNRTPVDRLHPNIRAWLTDTRPLPLLGNEELELIIDMHPLDLPKKLWAKYRPGEPYEPPFTWMLRRRRGG